MPSMKDIFSDYVFAFDVLCLKDARDISETNLQQLVSLVQKTLSDNILVVHGFQTMADSMDVVNNSLGYHKKKILFV